jgi:hypothetical protein
MPPDISKDVLPCLCRRQKKKHWYPPCIMGKKNHDHLYM